MENTGERGRLELYAARRAAQSKQIVVVVSMDNRLLTPKQRRRLRHKENSRKTHSHNGLPEYQVPGTERTKHVPCAKCFPQSKKKMVRIGGSEFRPSPRSV